MFANINITNACNISKVSKTANFLLRLWHCVKFNACKDH
jgi:hypothetical protein